ncbi:PIH1 domain-containing protein 1 [Condylostylus longicornis]|uniref:PIH1 domain-containing protein 1 n=1 Tax=Condylostylus longicornis TaxID=2530218 RepID=UPI00244E536C|nr:PIH1 domain-containing protein 1 [Condylostylus longicornis]
MDKKPNFLECDASILESNLKFIKSEYENEFEEIFGNSDNFPSESANSKIIKPTPGMCIKAFKVNSEEKFFINLCQTDGIPPPKEISENDLTEILQSDTPSSFRIPMSISQKHETKDNSGNSVEVCDIAINTKFFDKCSKIILFRDFLIALILEALDEKYNIQLKSENWLILKNRKFIGTLVSHRVKNSDVETVLNSYGMGTAVNEKKLIEEIKESENDSAITNFKNSANYGKKVMSTNNEKNMKNAPGDNLRKIKESIALANSKIPEYKVFSIKKNGIVSELLAEFWLPECFSINEIHLDIGEDRILLESMKRGYLFEKFTEYKINQEKIDAVFDTKDKMLRVKMGLMI